MLHKLEEEDYAARQAACYDLLDAANNDNLMNNILFNDEGIWKDEQPHAAFELQR